MTFEPTDGGETPPLPLEEQWPAEVLAEFAGVEVVEEKPKRKSRAKPKEPEDKPPPPADVLSTDDIAQFLTVTASNSIEHQGGRYIADAVVGELPGQIYVRTVPIGPDGLLQDQEHHYVAFVRQLS